MNMSILIISGGIILLKISKYISLAIVASTSKLSCATISYEPPNLRGLTQAGLFHSHPT